MSASPPNDAPLTVPDARVSALQAQAGTDASVTRGRWIAAGIVFVGMVGAVGVSLRPIYSRAFAAAAAAKAAPPSRTALAARRAATASAGGLSAPDEGALAVKLARLEALVAEDRRRHPLRYGILPDSFAPPTPLSVEEIVKRAQAGRERA